jgi:hypothetical protein
MCCGFRRHGQSHASSKPSRNQLNRDFLTLVFRGSCDSSPSSCYLRLGCATSPRHRPSTPSRQNRACWGPRPAKRPVLVSIFSHPKRREAQLVVELPVRAAGGAAASCARSCPAGSDCRHHRPRQPPHPGRHGQGPHLYQGRRRLRPGLHRTRLQRPVEHGLL